MASSAAGSADGSGCDCAYRDVDYLDIGLVVELDGRLGHELALDRWDDYDRDIASLVARDTTVRAGWGQVLNPCRLALAVARLMHALGWRGTPRPCEPGCPAGSLGGSPLTAGARP